MPEETDPPAVDRMQRERDLYRQLLVLGDRDSPSTFLQEALQLVVSISHARRGYLELQDPVVENRVFSLARGYSDEELAEVRRRISGGIIRDAMSTGATIHTPSALLDPRFQENESVQENRIAAVLCAPVGRDPVLGVVYLERGIGEGGFPPEDRELVEAFSRGVAPLASGLLRTAADGEENRAEPWRRMLQADRIIGRSQALADVLRQVVHLAPLNVSVFLTGETGTGKSAMARLLHAAGGRKDGPFVEVNCATIPEELAESELFGAEKGAHSTAHERRRGRVAAADGGTLFLDEVTELPLKVQAKLLQFLQDGTFYPLGSSRMSRAVVRVVAACNVDPREAMKDKRLRSDLYFRLMVMPLHIPSLAERREDIPALVTHFCEEAVVRNRLGAMTVEPAAMRAASRARWEGNIRELAHAVEAAVIRVAGEGGNRVEAGHLFPGTPSPSVSEGETWADAVRIRQREVLLASLAGTRWNVSESARQLGLSRSRVYELMDELGIERR